MINVSHQGPLYLSSHLSLNQYKHIWEKRGGWGASMEAQGAGTGQDQARGFWAWNGPACSVAPGAEPRHSLWHSALFSE